MKIFIGYASKTGTTEAAAKALAEIFVTHGDAVVLADITASTPDLSDFDCYAIGGSIRAGSLHKAAKAFAKENESLLMDKPLGLFCCHCAKLDLKSLLAGQLGEGLASHATALGSFGGTMDLSKQKGFEKLIVKIIAKAAPADAMDASGIKTANIAAFAEEMMNA